MQIDTYIDPSTSDTEKAIIQNVVSVLSGQNHIVARNVLRQVSNVIDGLSVIPAISHDRRPALSAL